MRLSIALLFALLFTIISCGDNDLDPRTEVLNLPDQTMDYSVEFPDHFGANFIMNRIGNSGNDLPEITNEGATLGRVLFYDKKLSANNSVACGTCHHQDKAFADGKRFSQGFEGRITPRNSMAIVNPILTDNLFWDSRSHSVVDLTLKPVQNHIEMGMVDMDLLVEKLQSVGYYNDLFEDAYGNSQITEQKISNALSQFLCSITSQNSKYDEGLTNHFADFTGLELLGKEIFFSEKAMCSSCHGGGNFAAIEISGPYQSTNGTANIGLDVNYRDQGKEEGQFRIPSLRNIALTAPYMHDGRFETLAEVIDHYDHGVQPHRNLDIKFKDGNGHPKKLGLSSVEKLGLEAFLKTLTDKSLMTDVRFSDPFEL